jgi:flavin-dependent dehydrogenase
MDVPDRDPTRFDVVVLGGGLAGLTVALQIKRRRPDTSVLVLEKRDKPAREAAFKVGESSMETAGYYFREVIGVGEHLKSRHTIKAGLRFFFPAGDNSDFGRRIERGPSDESPVESYQLDRGLFENVLADRAGEEGIDLVRGARVEDVELGEDEHQVTFSEGDGTRTVSARWVVDASGRASFLKRKLELAKEVSHTINSSWVRLKGGADLEDWVEDPKWFERMEGRGIRKRSTNHLMGEGYWVWLIQLGTGPISIGVCADPRFHPFDTMNTLDGFREWLRRHEPQVAAEIDRRPDAVMDFLKVEDFAFGAERVFSPDRWALTGEAGAFVDPLYSPGSDMISTSNTMVTDLVVRELDGEDVNERAETFNSTYLKFFDTVLLPTYTDQYHLFGNAAVMSAKISWDDAVRWTTLALRLMKGKWDDLEFLDATADDLDRVGRLNGRMQQFFRDWHVLDHRDWQDAYLSPRLVPCLGLRLVALVTPMDEETFQQVLVANRELLEALPVVMFHRVAGQLLDEKPDPAKPINPYAISLDPSRWEADGLFEAPGLTLEDALGKTPGIENIWVDEIAAAASGTPAS